MDLLQFLQIIEARQRALRTAARSLAGQPDSPQRRQAVVTTESSQRALAEEIELLKEKIKATLSPEGAQKAIEMLTNLANEARDAMFSAADKLHGSSLADAVTSQTEAVDKLDQIYVAVAPFPSLIQRAIGTQRGLVDQVAPAVENPGESGQLDFGEPAWGQRQVAGWAGALAPKAEQGLKGLEHFNPSAVAASPGGGSQTPAPDPEAVKKQMEGLRQSMEKAVELGPKVHELADEAAKHLEEKKPAEAIPKQEEALKLLKEIADPLPKQDENEQGEQKQDKQQGDQKQDQGQSGQQNEQQARQPKDLSGRQAEAVLRKARDRQRERRELDKQLQQYMYRPGAVEKDW